MPVPIHPGPGAYYTDPKVTHKGRHSARNATFGKTAGRVANKKGIAGATVNRRPQTQAAATHRSTFSSFTKAAVRPKTGRGTFGNTRRFKKPIAKGSVANPKSFIYDTIGPRKLLLLPTTKSARFSTAKRKTGPCTIQAGMDGPGPGSCDPVSSIKIHKAIPRRTDARTARLKAKAKEKDWRPGPGEYNCNLKWGVEKKARGTFGRVAAIDELNKLQGSHRYGLTKFDKEVVPGPGKYNTNISSIRPNAPGGFKYHKPKGHATMYYGEGAADFIKTKNLPPAYQSHPAAAKYQ